MSRSVSIDAMNKISYCLTYHSFLFYISKLLFVTVTLYFCIHFHLAPVEGLFFKPKYRANILCICFNFNAVLFLFLSSPWGSVYRFCTITYNTHYRFENVRRPCVTHSALRGLENGCRWSFSFINTPLVCNYFEMKLVFWWQNIIDLL